MKKFLSNEEKLVGGEERVCIGVVALCVAILLMVTLITKGSAEIGTIESLFFVFMMVAAIGAAANRISSGIRLMLMAISADLAEKMGVKR